MKKKFWIGLSIFNIKIMVRAATLSATVIEFIPLLDRSSNNTCLASQHTAPVHVPHAIVVWAGILHRYSNNHTKLHNIAIRCFCNNTNTIIFISTQHMLQSLRYQWKKAPSMISDTKNILSTKNMQRFRLLNMLLIINNYVVMTSLSICTDGL